MSSTANSRLILCQTELGWFGILTRGGLIHRIRIGFADAESLIEDCHNDSVESVDPNPPERHWIETLRRYATGEAVDFSAFPLDLRGRTPFQRAVLDHCRAIPRGSTMTYGQLAAKAGFPRAARAVGGVMRTNDHPIIIPCHRVIRSDRRIGNFSAPTGATMKQRLLELEGALPGAPTLDRSKAQANPVSVQVPVGNWSIEGN